MLHLTITTFYQNKLIVLDHHHVLPNKVIVPSATTTSWAIRSTTLGRNKEISLTEPVSYQRAI